MHVTFEDHPLHFLASKIISLMYNQASGRNDHGFFSAIRYIKKAREAHLIAWRKNRVMTPLSSRKELGVYGWSIKDALMNRLFMYLPLALSSLSLTHIFGHCWCRRGALKITKIPWWWFRVWWCIVVVKNRVIAFFDNHLSWFDNMWGNFMHKKKLWVDFSLKK